MRGSVSRAWGDSRRANTWSSQLRTPNAARQRIDFAVFEAVPPGFKNLKHFLDEHIDAQTEAELSSVRVDMASEIASLNLTKLRLAKGLNQSHLAQIIGTSQPRLSNWESGVDSPSLDSIIRLANALQVDFNTLIEALQNAKR